MTSSLQAIVRGRVHGVYYRAFVEERALELGLMGYVQNLRDGTVEVRAEGDRQKLEKLVDYLKVGPPAARVDEVVTRWSDYTGKYLDFNVTY